MTLEDLRSLDPKEILNWPLRFQIASLIALFLLVCALGYFVIVGEKIDELSTLETKEVQLKQSFIEKKRQAVNLSLLQQQLQEINASFGVLLKQLPTKSEMETVLTEINQAGVGQGLQFDLFKPNDEVKSMEMAEAPITIRLIGSYADLAAFVGDVAQMSRIVTISNILLSPVPEAKNGKLVMEATAKTFRSLEPEERAVLVEGAKP